MLLFVDMSVKEPMDTKRGLALLSYPTNTGAEDQAQVPCKSNKVLVTAEPLSRPSSLSGLPFGSGWPGTLMLLPQPHISAAGIVDGRRYTHFTLLFTHVLLSRSPWYLDFKDHKRQ